MEYNSFPTWRNRNGHKRQNGESLMKLMRLTTLLAACLFAMAAFAQQNFPAQENGEHKHGGQMDRMRSTDDLVKDLTTKLNLTADQQAKVKSILEENHQKMQATMKDESLSKEDKHAKMLEMHNAVHAQVRDVLTDEQKPKFDAMVKDMENNMHKKNGQGPDHDHK
jgi:Spy/CpxP family protein refolding chaperone